MHNSISAIILNLNKANEICQTLRTVCEQTIPFDEIIIIDDASTDDSIILINNFIQNVPNARLIQNEKRKGVVYGCNLGISESTSEFVYLISAEDTYSLRIVEHAKRLLKLCPDAQMLCGNLSQRKNGKTVKRLTLPFHQREGYISEEQLHIALKKRIFTFFGGANIIRKNSILEINGFNESLRWHSDWFIYLLIGLRSRIALIPDELRSEVLSDDQYSRGMYHWKEQKSVIKSLILTLKNDHPTEFLLFRQYALLPVYNLKILGLVLWDRELRSFLTRKLMLRCMFFGALKRIGQLIPYKLHYSLRSIIRI